MLSARNVKTYSNAQEGVPGMAATPQIRHSMTDAARTARQLAADLHAVGRELPDIRACLLADGSAGVHLGAVPSGHAARFGERLREAL
ncbi:hypothetical protein LO772_14895 [Yinghuangia sp. ASG 101]|uniref:hypothetical protein n=1 Tax=Yinghuangia sp. ASG 101 TaxID=2896848 RepID=UPI001E2AD415|nr:hypothetical protein [Yinghuangia sp. ASG 101]UGQ14742.1 hypothetical protein LO772_14895 [Yinghuangia sp. ASG 101]